MATCVGPAVTLIAPKYSDFQRSSSSLVSRSSAAKLAMLASPVKPARGGSTDRSAFSEPLADRSPPVITMLSRSVKYGCSGRMPIERASKSKLPARGSSANCPRADRLPPRLIVVRSVAFARAPFALPRSSTVMARSDSAIATGCAGTRSSKRRLTRSAAARRRAHVQGGAAAVPAAAGGGAVAAAAAAAGAAGSASSEAKLMRPSLSRSMRTLASRRLTSPTLALRRARSMSTPATASIRALTSGSFSSLRRARRSAIESDSASTAASMRSPAAATRKRVRRSAFASSISKRTKRA